MYATLLFKPQRLLRRCLKIFKNTLILLSSIITIALFSVSANALEIGVQAPDFELQTFSGDTFKLSDYRGIKPVYLVFWATWCPNCSAEIPTLKKLHTQLGDQVAMLAINIGFEDSLAKAQQYQQQHQLPYPLAFDENTVLTRTYGVVGTPWQVVIDINGTVRYFSHHTPQDIGEHLAELTQKKG